MIPFTNPQRKEERREMMAEERQVRAAQQTEIISGAMQDSAYQERKDENTDLTRWQQDLSEDVQIFIHGLKRERLNDKGEWVPQTMYSHTDERGREVWLEMPPMMNDLGISTVKNMGLLNISRNLIMSNLSEEQIFRKLRTNVINFISLIAENFNRFEIDKRDLSAIVQMYKDLIEPTHWRCLNNGERNYLNTINKRVEAYTEHAQSQDSKKGIMALLNS